MNRKTAREQAFILVFEKSLNLLSLEEIIEAATEARDFEFDEDGYIKTVFGGVYDNLEVIDEIIEKNLSGWKLDRISKVSLAILRLAIYEIKYMEDIPNSAAINEAVELTKKYAADGEHTFVNGVLGSVVKAEV